MKWLNSVKIIGQKINYTIGMMTPKQYNIMIDLLEQIKPKRICELGSGYSTRIFEMYQDADEVFSIENDPNYKYKSSIILPILKNTDYLGYRNCTIYLGFNDWIKKQNNFDFILIDGPNDILPINIDNIQYSRIQLLDFADKLNPGAIIMYHDSNLPEAEATLREFEKLLDYYNIQYAKEVIAETDKQIIEYSVSILGICPELTIYKINK